MERDVSWIGKTGDPNPISGTVASVREEPNGKGRMRWRLTIKTDVGLRAMDLFGDNQNLLIDKFGADEAKWIGQRVQILTEERIGGKGKERRIV